MWTVGEKFLQETKYKREGSLPESVIRKKEAPFKSYSRVPVFRLPEPETSNGPGVWDVLRKRRSIRDYSSGKISLKALSQLLWACQGVTAKIYGFLLRTVPSAGALYPYETYLYAARIEDLSPGIYHFNVKDFTLELICGGDFSRALCRACLGQEMLLDAAVTFIWSAVIDRCRIKYGERAFRYIFMDVGHVCQNLYIAATALGFGCCAIGAFYDDEINDLLGLDGVTESVIYLATVGVPRGGGIR